jgi:malate dehydrogenase
MEVIKGKGGTVFGPAFHIVRLIRAVLSETGEPAICSAVLEGEYGQTGCSLGVPVRIGREGIREIVEWDLDPWEAGKMDEAGRFVANLCSRVVL